MQTEAEPKPKSKPNWIDGYYSKDSMNETIRDYYKDKIPHYKELEKCYEQTEKGVIDKDIVLLNSQLESFENLIDTVKRTIINKSDWGNVITLSYEAKNKAIAEQKAKLEKLENEVLGLTSLTSESERKKRRLVTSNFIESFFPKNNIAGTPPYNKPTGFMPSLRLKKGQTDPSLQKMGDKPWPDPDWIDGYFSVAYLNNTVIKKTSVGTGPLKELQNKLKGIGFNLDNLRDPKNLDELIDAMRKYRTNILDRGMGSKYHYFYIDLQNKCRNDQDNLKDKAKCQTIGDRYNSGCPLSKDNCDLPTYNNTSSKKWFGGKRKQRRNKTNKLRTRTATKNTKNTKKTKKKNKRAKHSRKAKKVRKSRNARKTRKN